MRHIARAWPAGLAILVVAVLAGPTLQGSAGVGASSIPVGETMLVNSPGVHPIQHVVIIVLENEELQEVWAAGPYEKYLASTYGNATQDYAACHPSAPNYLAMVSTETNQCGSDNWNNYTNRTIANPLQTAGFSWAGYAESLPANACTAPGSATHGSFATRHVPFLYFANITSKTSYCQDHVLSSSVFNSSLANGTLRNYSFYTPNLCDDGHTGCGGNTTDAQLTAQADSWLRDFLSPILNHTGRYSSPKEQAVVNHTAFIVTFDEGAAWLYNGYSIKAISSGENYAWCQANGTAGDAVCGGRIFLTVISPYSLHLKYKDLTSQVALVTTVEWLFGLGKVRNPGSYDSGGKYPPLKGLFTFSSNGY
jgi:hypothetical protein